MKITSLNMANVKRVKAVHITPTKDGLTVIGGRNGQGKTSILDAIAYALGGEKYRPSNLKRDGAVGDTFIHIETDDGLVIDRKGANASLTVTDSTGKRAGQALLDRLIGKMALDLPKFMNSTSKEKANTLLGILGIGDELAKMEQEERSKYDERTAIGRLAQSKGNSAKEMEWYEDAPGEPISASEAVKEYEAILARNGLRAKARETASNKIIEKDNLMERIRELEDRIAVLNEEIAIAEEEDTEDEDTTALQEKIAAIEETNRKVRVNKERIDRSAEAAALVAEYNALSEDIKAIRQKRLELLNGADLPLPDLAIENGELLYKGEPWDCMSGAEQLIVACAIVSKLNPNCKFVLLDKLEQLDLETLEEFDKWLKTQGLQAIATRVSTGGECSIVIEDGSVKEESFGEY